MNTSFEAQAKSIRTNAENVLKEKSIESSIRRFGELFFTGSDRVPQMGSHLLYQAVILNGIRKRDELFAFFSKQGIEIKK